MSNNKLKWGFVFNGGESRLILGDAIVKPSKIEKTNEEIFANASNFLNEFELVENEAKIIINNDVQWGFTFIDGKSRLILGNSIVRPINEEMTNEEIFVESSNFLNNFELVKNDANFLYVDKSKHEPVSSPETEIKIEETEPSSSPETEIKIEETKPPIVSTPKPPIRTFVKTTAPVVKKQPSVMKKAKEITNPEFGARIKVEKNNNPVFENIYLDVKKNIPDEFVSTDVVEIIQKWYDTLSDNSATGYAYAYLKHLRDEGCIEEIGKVSQPNGAGLIKKYRRIKKSVSIDADYLNNVGKIEEDVKKGILN